MKIVLASNNRGKLTELQALLADLGVELIPQSALGISEAQEPFHSFLENALAKARHASAITGLPALACGRRLVPERLSCASSTPAAAASEMPVTPFLRHSPPWQL